MLLPNLDTVAVGVVDVHDPALKSNLASTANLTNLYQLSAESLHALSLDHSLIGSAAPTFANAAADDLVLSDASFGHTRSIVGMNTRWVVDGTGLSVATSTAASSRRLASTAVTPRVITFLLYVDLSIFAAPAYAASNLLQIYSGAATSVGSTLVYSLSGDDDKQLTVGRTNAGQMASVMASLGINITAPASGYVGGYSASGQLSRLPFGSNTALFPVQVLSSVSTLQFQSSAPSGQHYLAPYFYSAECPPNYTPSEASATAATCDPIPMCSESLLTFTLNDCDEKAFSQHLRYSFTAECYEQAPPAETVLPANVVQTPQAGAGFSLPSATTLTCSYLPAGYSHAQFLVFLAALTCIVLLGTGIALIMWFTIPPSIHPLLVWRTSGDFVLVFLAGGALHVALYFVQVGPVSTSSCMAQRYLLILGFATINASLAAITYTFRQQLSLAIFNSRLSAYRRKLFLCASSIILANLILLIVDSAVYSSTYAHTDLAFRTITAGSAGIQLPVPICAQWSVALFVGLAIINIPWYLLLLWWSAGTFLRVVSDPRAHQVEQLRASEQRAAKNSAPGTRASLAGGNIRLKVNSVGSKTDHDLDDEDGVNGGRVTTVRGRVIRQKLLKACQQYRTRQLLSWSINGAVLAIFVCDVILAAVYGAPSTLEWPSTRALVVGWVVSIECVLGVGFLVGISVWRAIKRRRATPATAAQYAITSSKEQPSIDLDLDIQSGLTEKGGSMLGGEKSALGRPSALQSGRIPEEVGDEPSGRSSPEPGPPSSSPVVMVDEEPVSPLPQLPQYPSSSPKSAKSVSAKAWPSSAPQEVIASEPTTHARSLHCGRMSERSGRLSSAATLRCAHLSGRESRFYDGCASPLGGSGPTSAASPDEDE